MKTRPFFDPVERRQRLERAAEAWRGTPFFAHAASQGHGVDCVRLVHELFIVAGAIPRLELPDYALDHAHHSTQTQLLRWLLDQDVFKGRLLFTPFDGRRLPGDLFGVRSGRIDHHLACALPYGRVVHAVENHGVVIHDEADAGFRKRVLYVLRLMEVLP